jgi:hypothetical protein
LALAPRFKTDPHYGDAIFEGSVVLGMNVLREGDVKTAVRYMEAATQAPSMSPETAFVPSLEYRLVNLRTHGVALSARPTDGTVADLAYIPREPPRRLGVHLDGEGIVRARR